MIYLKLKFIKYSNLANQSFKKWSAYGMNDKHVSTKEVYKKHIPLFSYDKAAYPVQPI